MIGSGVTGGLTIAEARQLLGLDTDDATDPEEAPS